MTNSAEACYSASREVCHTKLYFNNLRRIDMKTSGVEKEKAQNRKPTELGKNCIQTAVAMVGDLSSVDVNVICSWINTREKLLRVSGDRNDRLTPEILWKWISGANLFILSRATDSNRPLGFCTLSESENRRLPAHHIELCHLLVNPRSGCLLIGRLLCQCAKKAAAGLNKRCLCGRVAPDNTYGITIATQEGFLKCERKDKWQLPGFHWYEFPLFS